MSATLLVVHHSPTRSVAALTESVLAGAHDDAIAGVEVVVRPALEVWAYVQSRPDPDKVLLTMGKRDVGWDAGLPLPIHWHQDG